MEERPRPGLPILIVVSVDPETSPRACEAIRIALGIAAGDNPLTVVLAGPAIKILSADVDALVDGEDLARHLAALQRLGQVFHVIGDGRQPPGWNSLGLETRPLDGPGLARLITQSPRTLIF